jgi:hypothetical protein
MTRSRPLPYQNAVGEAGDHQVWLTGDGRPASRAIAAWNAVLGVEQATPLSPESEPNMGEANSDNPFTTNRTAR